MIDDNCLCDGLSEKPLKAQRDHGADEKVGFCWPEPRAAVCAALREHGAPRRSTPLHASCSCRRGKSGLNIDGTTAVKRSACFWG